MKRVLASSMVAAVTAMFACSEGGSGNTSGSGGDGVSSTNVSASIAASGTASSSATSTSTSAASTTTATTSGTGGGKASSIVVNEISGKSEDWVEIANTTDSPVDVSGWIVCDADATMMCDKTNAVTFPDNTSIPAKGYVVIIGKEAADAGVGPHAMCLTMGGPAICFWASWGISSTDGDMVFVHDQTDMPITQSAYPMNAAASGQTWCRLPDMTGDFAVCTPTPGAVNAATQ